MFGREVALWPAFGRAKPVPAHGEPDARRKSPAAAFMNLGSDP
jgi:hypothetical protein